MEVLTKLFDTFNKKFPVNSYFAFEVFGGFAELFLGFIEIRIFFTQEQKIVKLDISSEEFASSLKRS